MFYPEADIIAGYIELWKLIYVKLISIIQCYISYNIYCILFQSAEKFQRLNKWLNAFH